MLIRLAVLGLLVSVCLGKSLQTAETSSTDQESTISASVVENEITNSYETEGMEVQDNGPDDMQEPKAEDLIAQEHVEEDELDPEEDDEDEDEDEEDESVQGGFKLPFPLPSLPSLPGIHLPTILPAHPPSWMPYPGAWLHHLLPAYYPHAHQSLFPLVGPPPPPHVAHPAGTYLKPMQPEAESPVSSRRRRGAPLKKIEMKDPSEWWYDLDGAHKNKVTENLMRKAGFATYKHVEKQMDHYAPAIHIGKINMGLKKNPELEHPSRAAVGLKADWNAEDYEHAFAFQRHGQHVAWDMFELLRYFKAGKLPPGKKFIVSKKLVSPYSQCWFSHTNRHSFEELRVIDFTSVAARAKYWKRDDCRHFQPGVYELVAIKETLKDPSGKVFIADGDLTGDSVGRDVPVTADEPEVLAEEEIISEEDNLFKKRRKRSLGRKKRSESEFDFDEHDSDHHEFEYYEPAIHEPVHPESSLHDSLHHEPYLHDSLHHESSLHDSPHFKSSHHSPVHDARHFDNAYHHDYLQLKSVLIILKEVRTHYHGGRGYRAVLNFNPQALQEYSPVKVKSSHSKLVQESADGKVTKKFWFRQNAIPAGLNHQDTKSGSKVGFNDYRKPLTDHADYENTVVWGKPVMTKPKVY